MAKKTLRAKALDLIQKLARVSEADDNGYCRCVSCGESKRWNEGDGGHYIPKGNSSYWSLEIENVHFQCKGCNGYEMKYGTATQEYTKWMIDYYGREFVDDMEVTKRNVRKFYKSDYEEMIKEFKEKINYHLERIGER